MSLHEPPCFSIPLLGKSPFQEVQVFGHPELMGQVTLHIPPRMPCPLPEGDSGEGNN